MWKNTIYIFVQPFCWGGVFDYFLTPLHFISLSASQFSCNQSLLNFSFTLCLTLIIFSLVLTSFQILVGTSIVLLLLLLLFILINVVCCVIIFHQSCHCYVVGLLVIELSWYSQLLFLWGLILILTGFWIWVFFAGLDYVIVVLCTEWELSYLNFRVILYTTYKFVATESDGRWWR